MSTNANPRRPLLAAILSLLAPGAGQLYCRRPRRALVWFLPAVLLGLAYYILLPTGRFSEAPHLWWGWLAIVALVWLGSTIDAWLLAGRDDPASSGGYAKWYLYLPFILLVNLAWFLTPSAPVVERFPMPSGSMMPTLMLGDQFGVSRSAYQSTGPQPGDIVVIRRGDSGRNFVKRVIGLAGDRIQMKAGRLYLNGVMVEREPLGDFTVPASTGNGATLKRYRETLPNGRSYQIVEQSDNSFLDNTAEFAVPPGDFFLMSDNRDDSLDSRAQEFGPVAITAVIGRALSIEASPDPARIGSTLE
ncbi:signal peptidase I [Hypericibacter sp.]|uniref:signal peptidase I n=1 Tax=Hypericibacter sp. TaxID=2705401 RepID=UPI003D6D6139